MTEYDSVGHGGFYALQNDVVKYQLDSSDVLDFIEHYLLGEVWSHKEEKYIQRFEPIVNDQGFNVLINFLHSRVNKIFSLSKLSESEIYMMTRNLRFDLIDILEMRHKEFGMNKSNITSVLNMITDAVFATLKKSQDGTYMKLLQTTIKKEEITAETTQKTPQRKGLFSMFGG